MSNELPAGWIRAVLRSESGGSPQAVATAGAMGLMQIMPATWHELRIRHGLALKRSTRAIRSAPAAAASDRYGSIRARLVAYNTGPARYEASLVGEPFPPERRNYIAALAPIIDDDSAGAITGTVRSTAQKGRKVSLFAAQPGLSNSANAALLAPRPSRPHPLTVRQRTGR